MLAINLGILMYMVAAGFLIYYVIKEY